MPHHRTPSRLCISAFFVILIASVASATGRTEDESATLGPLVVGMMPAVDSIPLIVAQAEGFFADEGLEVTLELFRDQLYREASLQSNRIDATVSDLVNAIRAHANGADYRVLASTQGMFALLTAPDSQIRSLEEWPDAPQELETGVIEDSVIFYTAERMLAQRGADPARISIIPSLQIPVRLELLLSGDLEAAVLPEPVARLAELRGAHSIIDSRVLEATAGILIVTGTAAREKRAELQALLRAYNRAVEAVNAAPDAYRAVIVAAAGFPPPVAESMRIPKFLPAALPAPEAVADVSQWMIERGLIASAPDYDEIVLPLSE